MLIDLTFSYQKPVMVGIKGFPNEPDVVIRGLKVNDRWHKLSRTQQKSILMGREETAAHAWGYEEFGSWS